MAAVSIVSAAACTGGSNSLPEQPTERVASADATDDRIEQLLAQMTLEEKAGLLEWADVPSGDHEVGFIPGISRLGIPAQKFTDGPAGVRDGQPATAFPSPVAIAASFDPQLAHDVGARMGLETKARGYQVIYSPMVNIARVAQGGRDFETLGEDPFLAGQVAAGHIQGVQSQGVAAQVKHFAGNNQERNRMTTSSNIDERTLREIYLPAFETAVTKGGVWSFMCAYNQVNGVFSCENAPLLHSILKGQWQFDGVVGSDYPATHSTVAAAVAGLDQEFGGSTFYQGLPAAVRNGQLAQSVLDDHARRVLRMMFRTGSFDATPPPAANPADGAAIARSAAARGTVLLKNDTGVLPLDASSLSSIAVIGPFGNAAYTGGGGSSHVTPFSNFVVSPVAGLQQRAGSAVKVSYTSGASTATPTPVPVSALRQAGNPGAAGLTLSYFTNTTLSGNPALTTTDGVLDHDWQGNAPASGVPAQNWSARWTGTITAPVTGDYQIGADSDDGSRVFVGGSLVVDNWGDHAPQIVYGTVHLVAGQPVDLRVEYYQAGGGSNLTLSWMPPGQLDPGIQQAVDAAKNASAAVVVIGDQESEGSDRPSISLTGNQNALVAAVEAANPRTVVVVNSGAPVTMPWAANVHALVEAWYPGEQDGAALADILFGDVDPSGRLPVTFPAALGDGPLQTSAQYPGDGATYQYTEKLEVGYRWFDAHSIAPLFPFGHGLSYTTFAYSNFTIGAPAADGSVTVAFDVRNSGARAGTAVPQIYVGFPSSAGEPPRRLAGFDKVAVASGQTAHVSLVLDKRAFSIWNVDSKSWVVPGGAYTIAAGASSRDIRLSAQANIPAANPPTGTITGVAGKCIDIAGAATANGTAVQLFTCNGTGAQNWIVADDNSLRGLGKCVDVPGASFTVGQVLQLFDCNDTDAQKWRANASGQIVNYPSGLCLDSQGGASTDRTRLVLNTCNTNSASQKWVLPH